MSDWFERYLKQKREARGNWTTHPPFRRVEYEQRVKFARLAYGCACLIEAVKE